MFNENQFEIIFYDEAHHFDNESETNTFDYIFKYFKPINNIALTATPERRKGLESITKIFKNILCEMQLHEAIKKNLVCEIDYYLLGDKSGIELSSQDLKSDVKLLIKADNIERNNLVLESIRNYISDCATTIIFCINIDHAKKINNLLIKNGYNSSYLVSGDEKRKEKLNRFANKQINYLCVVDILNEGIDIPHIDSIIFLRPTQSKTIYLQQLGRGLRKKENKKLKVIDIATNINIKDYWINRFCNILSDVQIIDWLENDISIFEGINLYLDKLSKTDLLKKLKEQKRDIYDSKCKNYITWDLECYVKNTKNVKKFTLIFDDLCKNWFEIFEKSNDGYKLFDIYNCDMQLEYKYYGLNFEEFDIIKFLKITKKNDVVNSNFILNNIENIIRNARKKVHNLPYNYSLKYFPSSKTIKDNTLLFYEFKNGKKARVMKISTGYYLLKDSYIAPYKRNIISKEVIDFYNLIKVPHGYKEFWKVEKDYFFKRFRILSDIVVGGKSSFPNIFCIEKSNKSLRNYYISNVAKIIKEFK